MNTGFIKLHRSLVEWEWYQDSNTMRLFLHCLLKANYTEKKWQGKTIPRGSFLTGLDVLASELNLTQRKIRTSLTKLKTTGELTIKTTNKGSIVSVCNYDTYQSLDQETDNKPNDKRTTNG